MNDGGGDHIAPANEGSINLNEADENLSNNGNVNDEIIENEIVVNDTMDDRMIELLADKTRLANKVDKHMTLLEDLMQTNNTVMMNSEVSNLDKLLADYMYTNEAFEAIVDPQARTASRITANELDDRVFSLKQRVSTWFKDQDCSSSSSSKSKRSSIRSKSRGSSPVRSDISRASHTSLKSVENRAALEALKVELTTIEGNQKQILDEKLRKEKQDLDKTISKLKKKIEIAEVKQRVYDEPDFEKLKKSRNITVRKRHAESVSSHRLPLSPTVGCSKEEDSLAHSMMQMMNACTAPVSKIDIFTGDHLEYDYFKATFRDVVESKIHDQKGRLVRLIEYTSGEPKEIVREFIHDDPHECYNNAIKALDREFGNAQKLTAAYLKELKLWPSIKNNDTKGFRKILRFLLKCKIVKRQGKLSSLDSVETMRTVIGKFNPSVQRTWNKVSHRIMSNADREVKFDDLVDFIEEQSSLVNNPYFSADALLEVKDKIPASNVKSFITQIPDDSAAQGPLCYGCDSVDHSLSECPTISAMNMEDRQNLIKSKRLCFGCLKPSGVNHYGRVCKKRLTCEKCSRLHPTILHEFHENKNSQVSSANATSVIGVENAVPGSALVDVDTTVSVSTVKQQQALGTTSLCVIPVYIYSKACPERRRKVYAMLDSCSQGTFISEELIEALGVVKKRATSITVKTMNGEESTPSLAVQDLVVAGVENFTTQYGYIPIDLPTAYSQTELPFGVAETPSPDKLEGWSYLNQILPYIPDVDESIPVGLLIGSNCVKALEPCEAVPSQNDGPCAVRTKLGWCVIGPMDVSVPHIQCNFVGSFAQNRVDYRTPLSHVYNSVTDDSTHKFLEEMYNIEFSEVKSEQRSFSREDETFLKVMEKNLVLKDHHYILPLPFRDTSVNLPNNKLQARKRCDYVKKRMLRNVKYAEDYKSFMNKLIDKGYAVRTDDEEVFGKTWYLPHHGVYHPTKKKIRVVFDAAAKYEGMSLNKELISGPDLTNSLVGVLIRFRKGLIPFTADIESMFYQVGVPKEHQDYLRFMWWPNGDVSKELSTYKMTVHVFGSASSPGCSNYALRQTALDNAKHYSERAVSAVLEDFYVDDLLKSVDSISEGVELAPEIESLCAKGGFNLTKFVSSRPEVLKGLPEEKKSEKKDISIDGTGIIERALGVVWCLENDCLTFHLQLKDSPLTRRGVLSTMSSIFDPLGLASPFLLKGKRILQMITGEKCDWDDPISDTLRHDWERWRSKIFELQNLKIDRCYKSKDMKVKERSIVCFSDASDIGYGNACYLRQVYENDEIEVSLVMGKSRVAPLKPTTVPRLELTAATTSVKLTAMVHEELKYVEDVQLKFLTDSTIVLGYINNLQTRFRVFVANRLKTIHDYSHPGQWNHVATDDNPADYATRGISVSDHEKVKCWLSGPPFLLEKGYTGGNISNFGINEDDPEVKITSMASLLETQEDDSVLAHLIASCSKWTKMKRVIAWVLRFIAGCRGKRNEAKTLGVEEIVNAERYIVRLVQDEGAIGVATSKNLRNLDLFQDENGLIRVGGRLRHSDNIAKHPVVLPKKSPISRIIIEHFHKICGHSGRTTTVAEVRTRGYWIIGMNTTVRSVVYHCVTCKKLRGKLSEQKMADFPEDCCKSEGPFVYSGIDVFGPFTTKNGRKSFKRFVCLFICLSSKGIHLEVLNEMTTDSFINALRRFLSRRGYVRVLRADNGTNFVGAENEMLNLEKINNFLTSNGCELITWKRNPPLSSHRGGVWERAIRSIRAILGGLLNERNVSLDDEQLNTFLCEAEYIANSRPLSVDCLSDEKIEVLTPNHILTMKEHIVAPPPPGRFEQADLYCRKRWKRVQFLAEQFWNKWRKEYLSLLQSRKKWNKIQRNFTIGDIVLMYEDNVVRSRWPLARVVEIEKGQDDLVRGLQLKTAGGKTFRRPIQKVVLLLEA